MLARPTHTEARGHEGESGARRAQSSTRSTGKIGSAGTTPREGAV